MTKEQEKALLKQRLANIQNRGKSKGTYNVANKIKRKILKNY